MHSRRVSPIHRGIHLEMPEGVALVVLARGLEELVFIGISSWNRLFGGWFSAVGSALASSLM